MVTIKDVARDAGVSVGTVSNVLNGGRVSEARRKLVEASIEKLGYQVNTLAKGMRMQKTDYVVVILPNLINPYFALLLDALESELSAVGKQVLLCLSGDDAEREVAFMDMAKQNKVDGIIGVTYSKVEEERIETWLLFPSTVITSHTSHVWQEITGRAAGLQQRICIKEDPPTCCAL